MNTNSADNCEQAGDVAGNHDRRWISGQQLAEWLDAAGGQGQAATVAAAAGLSGDEEPPEPDILLILARAELQYLQGQGYAPRADWQQGFAAMLLGAMMRAGARRNDAMASLLAGTIEALQLVQELQGG